MPQQDEALKALVTRFRESPERGFVPLASALLSRGHAAEALRVAEHGLQTKPESVEGRVERAAALLALGRPRVAYVELRRALAIDPAHRRGMRLLGKAYVDSGAPGRAAALLAKRSAMAPIDDEPTAIAPSKGAPKADVSDLLPPNGRPAPERPSIRAESLPEPEPDLPPAPAFPGVPDLFSDLTKDLGLGAAIPELSRRVEVTQIIRRKAMPRPPRSVSELAEIEGPIVDTTQPGELHEVQTEDATPMGHGREPAPLFGDVSGSGFEALGLDDEPLFQEHLPFDVRPVSESTDLPETRDTEPPTTPSRNALGISANDGRGARGHSDLGDTLVEYIEAQGAPLEALPTARAPAPLTEGLTETPPPRPPAQRIEAASTVPLVEINRPKDKLRLEIVEPTAKRSHVVLGVIAAALMVAYFFGLAWVFREDLGWWIPGHTPAPKGTAQGASPVAPENAQAKGGSE